MGVAAVETYAAGNTGASDTTTQPVVGGTGCCGILACWRVVEGGGSTFGPQKG